MSLDTDEGNGDHLMRPYRSPCEDWTPEQKGRALEMIRLLAITPYSDWRTKKEIHAALAEFR